MVCDDTDLLISMYQFIFQDISLCFLVKFMVYAFVLSIELLSFVSMLFNMISLIFSDSCSKGFTFCEKVKESLQSPADYLSFLNSLRIYSTETITRNELQSLVCLSCIAPMWHLSLFIIFAFCCSVGLSVCGIRVIYARHNLSFEFWPTKGRNSGTVSCFYRILWF